MSSSSLASTLPAPADGSLTARYLDVRAAGAYLSLSKSLLDKLRVAGGGPAYITIGRTVRYDVRDLDEWMGARRRRHTSDGAQMIA